MTLFLIFFLGAPTSTVRIFRIASRSVQIISLLRSGCYSSSPSSHTGQSSEVSFSLFAKPFNGVPPLLHGKNLDDYFSIHRTIARSNRAAAFFDTRRLPIERDRFLRLPPRGQCPPRDGAFSYWSINPAGVFSLQRKLLLLGSLLM